jgi:hypothetical protein
MRFWLEFFKDKRFSWDFKIANFIMRDDLRHYLAIDCAILNEIAKSNDCTDFHKKRINKIISDLNILMKA